MVINENSNLDMVSIITPGYNEEKNIYRLLDSILKQTYSKIEFVFIDDGSTDNTKQVIEEYKIKFSKRGFKIKYFYQENKGQSAAINIGLQNYTGEYLTWIDADDFLDTTSISKRVNALKEHGEEHFVITQAKFVDEHDVNRVLSVEKRIKPIGKDNFFIDLIYERNILWASGGGFMVRAKDFQKAIPLNTIFPSKGGQNFQLMAPLAFKYKCIYIEEPLYSVVCRSNSHSRINRSLDGMIEYITEQKDHKVATIRELYAPNENELISLTELVFHRKLCALAFKNNNKELFDKNFLKIIQYMSDVYENLEDETSKKIFKSLAEYYLTYDISSIEKIVMNTNKNFKNQINLLKNNILSMKIDDDELIIIYGAGFFGEFMLRYLKSKFPNGKYMFCDRNYEIIKEVKGYKVISPQELFSEYRTTKVVVPKNRYTKEIINELNQNLFPKEKIYTSNQIIFDLEEYFDKDIIRFSRDEVFVDAGAYDGEVSLTFASKCPDYKKIILIEPDSSNIVKVSNKTKNLLNSHLISKGVWNKKSIVNFDEKKGEGSRISADTIKNEIHVDSLDNICADENVTFIKLDVEGAELNALIGAEKIIVQNKPKLAVCIYHKPEDLYEIPRYLKSIVPDYKFYIRHYSNVAYSTVLYAVIN